MSSRILPLITFLLLLAQSAFAQNAEIPFSGGRPQVEYKKTGNTYQWKPVTGKMPSQGVVFGSGHGVSNAEPKINTQGKLPYSTKPGASTGPLKVSSKISPVKFGAAAVGVLAGAASTWPVQVALGLGAVACNIYCDDLAQIMKDNGLDHFRKDENGNLEFLDSDDSDFVTSLGFVFYTSKYPNSIFYSHESAIKNTFDIDWRPQGYTEFTRRNYNGADDWYGDVNCGPTYYGNCIRVIRVPDSSCPPGHRIKISTNQCFEPNDGRYSKKSWQELEDLFGGYAENLNGSSWSNSRAPHLAAKLAPQYDILDDTQPADVTGPASAPISETTTRESVNLQPGTNTPVAPGHVGPTDSGTRTTTKTTTAQNTYSGDTMTTTTVTNTTTNITNNITNTTINTGTSEEEADKAPEQDKPTCEEKPDSLECAELDTPEGEIPRDEIQITFQPDDLGLGGGSCPSDRSLGGDYVFSYAATCDMLSSYGRYLVWVLASMSALLIIFAGRSEA